MGNRVGVGMEARVVDVGGEWSRVGRLSVLGMTLPRTAPIHLPIATVQRRESAPKRVCKYSYAFASSRAYNKHLEATFRTRLKKAFGVLYPLIAFYGSCETQWGRDNS